MTIIPYSINRKEIWDEFVGKSKNGTFLLQRGFMDYHADRYFDCSLLVYEGISPDDEYKENGLTTRDLVALFPANWVEEEKCVYSHQGLTYGGLVVRTEATQTEVMRILQAIMLYYADFLQARKLVYKPIPYIYCPIPCAEDLYALFRAGAKLCRRLVSTVVPMQNPMKMRTLRLRQARKALDHGCYIERLSDSDVDGLAEYWTLLDNVLQKRHNAHPVHSLGEIQTLAERFPKNIRLYVAKRDRKIVAGTVIFETRQVAHVQYIAAGDEGRELGALDLLFRHLINERYRDMQFLDFGTSNEDGGRYLNEGLIFQKEGFGGRAVCYDTYETDLDKNTLRSMTGNVEDSDTQIPYLDLKMVNKSFEPQLSEEIARVAHSGWYLLGEECKRFENEYAAYCGTKHCVATGNCLDALTLVLMAYKETEGWKDGDEVIVPSNTYIASILAISRARLTPVLCEPRLQDYLIDPSLIEPLVTPRTRCIMPVHLYGRVCDMGAISDIASRHGLKVVEDAAQAQGARYRGRVAGSLGDAAATSFYPGKNIGALADAGCVTTDDTLLAHVIRSMANYGSDEKYVNTYKGINSRMDETSAAVVSLKLKRLDEDNMKRRHIADLYDKGITNPLITLPDRPEDIEENVYHIYPVRCPDREALKKHLASAGIQTMIHYPIPPHKQQAYREWNDRTYRISERIHKEIISLPISPVMTDAQVMRVIETINVFSVEL